MDTAIHHVLDYLPVVRESPKKQPEPTKVPLPEPPKVEPSKPDPLEFALGRTVMLVNCVNGFALDMGTCEWKPRNFPVRRPVSF